jgi:hypothetical protein
MIFVIASIHVHVLDCILSAGTLVHGGDMRRQVDVAVLLVVLAASLVLNVYQYCRFQKF